MARFFCILLLAFSILQCGSGGPGEEDIRENNRGVGLMGYFKYQEAADVFAPLLEKYPQWSAVKVNLGIATLNLQKPGSEEQAMNLFAEVLAQEPENARALYCTGLLHVYRGQDEQALTYFRKVAELKPNDPHARYYLGQCVARNGDHETALTHYQEAARLDPYLRSAYYGAFQAYQRLKQRDKAREMIGKFQKLKNNPQARQVEFKYTRMGALAEVATANDGKAKMKGRPSGNSLAEAQSMSLPDGIAWRSGKGVTAADINGDGLLDLFAAGHWEMDGKQANGVYFGAQDGFQPQKDHPLVAIEGVNAALWGDIDHDGHLDVYLCRNGVNQLWRGTADHSFVEGSEGVTGGEINTLDGALVDADHDGDLDIFLANEGPNELLNNNLDGTWRALAMESGIAGNGNSQSVMFTDVDNDRDVDILVVNQTPPHEVYINELLWAYQPGSGFDALLQAPMTTLIVGDLEADGQVELFSHDGTGNVHLWRVGHDAWQGEAIASDVSSAHLGWLDMTGAGRYHLLTLGAQGFGLHDPTDPQQVTHEPSSGGTVSWSAFVGDVNMGPSVVTANEAGELFLHTPGPGRLPYVGLQFRGAIAQDGATRSNMSGIGARYAVRNGSTWTAASTWRQQSGPGQSLSPHAIGLGGALSLDFVAITWSDGVYQTELQLEQGKLHTLTETQRQLASCPVLFVWDGERFQFVSDVLGVGGIGFNVGRGTYSNPRPWEHFQLPQGLAQTVEGKLRLKIAEPMEESAYLDHAEVLSYDLPPGWNMVLDERLGTAEPLPTGDPVFYREEHLPLKVLGYDGSDITETVLKADHKAAPVPQPDKRFLGLLQQEHQVTLTFENPLDSEGRDPWLVIDGWVEYPYSQTCFAAWQAGLSYQSLSLDVARGDKWETTMSQFGYPAGMPRRMSVPLTGNLQGVTSLRLRTNQEVYLDRIAVVYREDCPEAVTQVMPLTNAHLAAEGFALRTTGPQRLPGYDDTRRQPLWDTRHQSGFYTALGKVEPLLQKEDDALAILGPGEAVTMDFGPVAPKQEGYDRHLVLRIQGWCKDMDLYTRDGETLTPLPGKGLGDEQSKALMEQYNTRFQAGY